MSEGTKRPRGGGRSLHLLSALILGVAGGAGAPERAAAQAATGVTEEPATVLFTNATLVDGMGAPGYVGDLLIDGGRIAALGAPGSVEAPPDAERRDLTGLVLAPGFIDIHNHSTDRLFNFPLATTQLAQGITTIVVGADGSSPWPISDYLARIDELRPTVDVATLVGHGTVRRLALGENYRRSATDAEIADMTVRVERGMTDGAFGLSSGLEYDPGFYSTTGELIAVARAAAGHGGFYMTHMRDEEEGLMEAVDEAIRIGREAGLPVQISHIKAGNASVWGRAPDVLERIRRANDEGLDVTADQYPYAAWQSGLAIVVRSRMFSNPDSVAKGIAAAGGANRLQIVAFWDEPELNGLRLDEIARRRGMTDVEAYIWIMENGGSGLIGHTMNEDDVDTFMASPWVMTSSDGGVRSAHPRGAGTFPRVLGHYVRERGILTLERAVQRGTSMPARRLKLNDRGVLRAGARADLVIFDPVRVVDRSTFDNGTRQAEGVESVWLGGVETWSAGEPTGARPGRAIRRAP
ncbi:D-aminoacylase [Candidatus Palauibacter polyketidifaciens]|uniref:N-acyl-D-amino-acid deacylase family protein n=1 Tax=Candidatus Palauibacter polyketidifaciens TaxID=3056740 RepID=UPI00139E9BC7|nr:D-aminoacylase [Candidatus Palauibacter polyketidifaciens]MDE2719206.1 D-aminoacylase [Candidatus Palauibacter polyketidifaciens]MYE33814.1 D-aminoacylase [Gemmatimonadales bacterium]